MTEPVYSEGPWSIDRTGIVDLNGDNIFVVGSDSTCWWKASEDANLMSASIDLLLALRALFDDYKQLADSGDAGFWKLEDLDVGKQALAAIAKAEGRDV